MISINRLFIKMSNVLVLYHILRTTIKPSFSFLGVFVPWNFRHWKSCQQTEAPKKWHEKLIIIGDFNIHMDEPHTSDTSSFNEVLDTFDLCQHVKESTHTSGHTIDLCITSNNSELQISTPVIGYFISHHAFTSFHLNVPKPPIQRVRIKSRAISRINRDNFRQDLINLNTQLVSASETSTINDLAHQYDNQLI